MENVVLQFTFIPTPEETKMYNKSVLNETKYNMTYTPTISGFNYISEDALINIKLIVGMVLIPLFAFFGSIGNIFSLIVIFHQTLIQRMRNSTNICLAGLALSDLFFLFHCLLFAGINVHIHFDPSAGKNVRAMMFPVFGAYGSLVTARITTLMTLLLCVERFIAVHCPMKAKVMCNQTITFIAVCVIYVITALLFLPYIFKYKIHYIVTKLNQTRTIVMPSDFGKKEDFFEIYGIVMNVFFRLLPIFLLIIMNIRILLVIHRTWNRRKAISNVKSSSSGVSEQHHITIMLLIVSFIFLICILPGAISSIITHIWPAYNRGGSAKDLFEFVNYLTYFLETINSSINFIIYMALSKRFCKTYKRIFCCQKQHFYSMGSNRSKLSFSHDRSASYRKEQDHLIKQKPGGSLLSLDTKYTADHSDQKYSPTDSLTIKKRFGAFRRSHSQNSIYKKNSPLKVSPNIHNRSFFDYKRGVQCGSLKSSPISENGHIYNFQTLQQKPENCATCEYQLQNGRYGASQDFKNKKMENGHINGNILTMTNLTGHDNEDFV